MKYLSGHRLSASTGPSRWDGILLLFRAKDLAPLINEVAGERRAMKSVTMAEARLSDRPRRCAPSNDSSLTPDPHLGPGTTFQIGERHESHFSSGSLCATGNWGRLRGMKSIVTGSVRIANAACGDRRWLRIRPSALDTKFLTFAVREPFPSRSSLAELVYGTVTAERPLKLRSHMPENGVIFSDVMESDYLRFTGGLQATIDRLRAGGDAS